MSRDFYIATAIILLSSLPFIHEFFFDDNYELWAWVPNQEIQYILLDDNGKFLGYSYYDVFLYHISVLFYVFFGTLTWVLVKKRRGYELALLLPLLSVGYHILITLLNARSTEWNNSMAKLSVTVIIAIILAIVHYYGHLKFTQEHGVNLKNFGISIKNAFTPLLITIWISLFILSTFPYINDLITDSSGTIRDWVPSIGIKNFFTLGDNTILGFNSYKVFLHEFFINLMALIVWYGCFFDAKYKLYKPFFLVPVVLSFFEIMIIATKWKVEYIGYPGWKLALTLTTGFIVAIYFFVRNKHLKSDQIPHINT